MGNEASSENERQVRHHMVSYKQFVRDLARLNALCAVSFVDGRTGCHLSFEAVTNLAHHELLPVLWRQEGRLLVIVHRVEPSAASTDAAAVSGAGGAGSGAGRGSAAEAECERKAGATLRAAKSLTAPQFYHLFLYCTQNAPVLLQARAQLRAIGQQRRQQQPDLAGDGSSDDSRVCSICLSAGVEVALPCLHAFCTVCIEDWHTHDQSCPLCRMKADVNGPAGDVWLMDGGSEAELTELSDTITNFPHRFLLDKPDFVE